MFGRVALALMVTLGATALVVSCSSPTGSGGSGSDQVAPGQGTPPALLADAANAHRLSQGLDPLEWSDSLAAVAQSHCDDMHARNYYSHTTPDGVCFTDRLAAAGISYRSAGENIAKGFDSADDALLAWLSSPGHKRNIEGSSFTHHGIGFNAEEGLWTHLFIGTR